MTFMPGDNRARSAYDRYHHLMGGMDYAGIRPLPRWDQLNDREQRAFAGMIDEVWTDATLAAARMNSPTAGMYGDPGRPPAGMFGGTASAVPRAVP